MNCIFCSNPSGSPEHVLPLWLLKHLQIVDERVTPTRFHEATGFKFGKTTKFRKFTTDTVCSQCNTGWMSQLENWLSKHVKPFFSESWEPEVHLPEIYSLRPEAKTLARWLLKTGITFQQVMPPEKQNEISSELYPSRERRHSRPRSPHLGRIHRRAHDGHLAQKRVSHMESNSQSLSNPQGQPRPHNPNSSPRVEADPHSHGQATLRRSHILAEWKRTHHSLSAGRSFRAQRKTSSRKDCEYFPNYTAV